MKLIEAALLYGKLGWKIFPITPGAKNPPFVKWSKEATDNAAQITLWWTKWPTANIGLACQPSGLSIVDIDAGKGKRGLQSLDLLLTIEGKKFSETRTQRTPSRGLHYIYSGKIPSSQNAIGRDLWPDGISNIDTRGATEGSGGYILLPPSIVAGRIYEWVNGITFPIAPLDQWVSDYFDEESLIGHNQAPQEFMVEPDSDYEVAWFKRYLDDDASRAIEGEGGELRTLSAIGGVAKDHGISEGVALDLIYNSLWNLECQPPWKYDELETKIHNAYTYLTQNKPGEHALAADEVITQKPTRVSPHKGDARPHASLDNDDLINADEPTISQAEADELLEVAAPPNNDDLFADKPSGDDDDDKPPRGGRADDFADDPVDDSAAPANNDDLFDDKSTRGPSALELAKQRVLKREKELPPRLWSYAELCDEWVYIAQMHRFVWEKDLTFILKKEQFDDTFAYCKPENKKLKTLSAVMFKRMAQTIRKPMRAVFLPGEPPGMTKDGDYNFYRPSEVVATQGDTEFWNDHLEYLWPEQADRDLVLNWCAWLLQNISLKPKHALLLAGYVHGTGKSFIGEVLTKIIGSSNVTPVGSHELASAFNKWALGSKLLTIEELDDVEKNIIKHTLHPIITQEELTINDKGVSTFKSRNCFGIFCMTNEDAALRLSSQDRRYLVVRTIAQPKHQHYYHHLYSILDDDEAMGAIAYELLHRDVGEYNGQSRAPDTAAKAEMVDAGRSDLEKWMMDNAGVWPLNARVICIDDIISQLPSRLERLQRLQGQIQSIVKHHFKGIPLGQTVLPGHERASLWLINGAQIPRIEGAYGVIYMKDKAARGVTAKDNEIKSEFSE